jgi:hypothetical protein
MSGTQTDKHVDIRVEEAKKWKRDVYTQDAVAHGGID